MKVALLFQIHPAMRASLLTAIELFKRPAPSSPGGTASLLRPKCRAPTVDRE
jgi:hypothetical protein